ncbi:hypothetical protein Prudu_012079 [Prunus dulcis]|uniref:Uncharacterized protein n=1 Tax=Prunus dulcis TaxID=3755 RepID=A0A4Y1RCI4_PRUDU|nr:hypothetical protein Prudu_012079 [Prunus dulcis]
METLFDLVGFDRFFVWFLWPLAFNWSSRALFEEIRLYGISCDTNGAKKHAMPSQMIDLEMNQQGEDEYGRNSRIMDDVRGPCKRKNPEGLPGNFQYFNASATSSSSVPPLNIRNPDGVAVMDAVTFALPQYVELAIYQLWKQDLRVV